MTQRDAALESLLQSLRGCHEPAPRDRRRVRAALDEVLVEGVAKPVRLHAAELNDERDEEEASGVHSKPDGRVRARHFRHHFGPSHLLVGALALAAAAAVAVVALARPGALEGTLVARNEVRGGALEASSVSESELHAEPVLLGHASARALLGRDLAGDELEFEPGPRHECERWPCLATRPERVITLAGVGLEPEAPAPASSVPAERVTFAPQDEARPAKVTPRDRVEVTPVVAFDITRDRVSPGVGIRLAAAVTEKREIAVQATAQRFDADTDARGSLWALSSGVCWNPMAGKVDVSLCGTLGYERSRSNVAPRTAWRVTAGAEAHTVWNVTHAAGVYLAFQTAAPVIGDRPSDRMLSMRVMAGPEFRF